MDGKYQDTDLPDGARTFPFFVFINVINFKND